MSDVSSTRSLQAKLADLHIFVVPVELWLDKYRTAFNNIALESVSAGFVRVHPDLSLHHLRECLEEQLGEEVIPEEFIFLRSVGRCMAIVKQNQERLLKAKDFLPPTAYSPEIFLLPGSHETYARPSTDSNNVVIATQGHTTAGMSTTNPFHLPLITQQNLVTQPGFINQQGYHSNQPGQEEGYGFHRNKSDQTGNGSIGNQRKQSQSDSFDSERSSNSLEDSNNGDHGNNTRRLSKDSEDSGYTPRRQKKSSIESKTEPKIEEPENHVNRASPVEYKTVKIIEPQVVHSVPYQGPDGRLIAPPTPIPSGRVIASPLPGPRKNKGDKTENNPKEGKKKSKKGKLKQRSRSSSLEKQKADKTENAEKVEIVPIQDDVIPTIEDVEDRSKYAQFPSPAKSTRPSYPYANENGLDSGIADDSLESSQELSNSLNGGKLMANDELSFDRQNGFDAAENDNDRLHLDESALLSKESAQATDSNAENNKQDNKSNITASQTTGKNTKNPIRKPKKTVKKTVKKTTDDLDEKLKKLKKVEPPPVAVPDPGSVTFERDTHSAKERKQKIIEELRGQLRKAKNERVDLEKQRDQKVRRAKSLQTQTLQKRNQAKNIWKKKFFDEKRKTAPLEEQLNRLRYDVEVQHKAILDLLESKDRDGIRGSKEQDKTPSEKTNQLMLLARIQSEVEDLKHKIEELKMKLASEMKLRDTAQRELKQLREDLVERKINLTLTKSQKSLVVLNPANITAQ